MKYLTLEQFKSRFCKESQADIDAALARYPTATGMVLFVNHDLGSRNVGHVTAGLFGPDNTYKTEEDAIKHPPHWSLVAEAVWRKA